MQNYWTVAYHHFTLSTKQLRRLGSKVQLYTSKEMRAEQVIFAHRRLNSNNCTSPSVSCATCTISFVSISSEQPRVYDGSATKLSGYTANTSNCYMLMLVSVFFLLSVWHVYNDCQSNSCT